jgi:hypothetical protein
MNILVHLLYTLSEIHLAQGTIGPPTGNARLLLSRLAMMILILDVLLTHTGKIMLMISIRGSK